MHLSLGENAASRPAEFSLAVGRCETSYIPPRWRPPSGTDRHDGIGPRSDNFFGLPPLAGRAAGVGAGFVSGIPVLAMADSR